MDSNLPTWAYGLFAFLLAFGTLLLKYGQMRSKIQQELDQCEDDKRKLHDRLSALETEMVVLRKLLPGGEWYKQLGLDRYPPADDKL